jgi:hypothetical protein
MNRSDDSLIASSRSLHPVGLYLPISSCMYNSLMLIVLLCYSSLLPPAGRNGDGHEMNATAGRHDDEHGIHATARRHGDGREMHATDCSTAKKTGDAADGGSTTKARCDVIYDA